MDIRQINTKGFLPLLCILVVLVLQTFCNTSLLLAQDFKANETLVDSTVSVSVNADTLNQYIQIADSVINEIVDDVVIPEMEDSIVSDSISIEKDSVEQKSENSLGIEAEVSYSAKDSTLMTNIGSRKAYLYGDAELEYQDIKLTAAFIELDLDSSIAYASGVVNDSSGVVEGLPVFTDKSGSYEMKTIRYNFKSGKAIIQHVVTQQGEGYIVSERAKKAPDNSFCIADGHYSTCDNHDHPHFYINLTKAKVIPGKKTITGPAYLVIEDVPIYPLVLPFGYVPTTSSYSSGVIFPSYGEESTRGLFLRDGGYYWAASDYFDLSATGDIYTNGSWAARLASKYKSRYKFGGNFNLQYIENVTGEKDLPDYSKTKDFSITWSHSQDAKANPNQSFSASVNFSTSSFDQNNVSSIIDPEIVSTNTKSSSVSYSRSFPNSPFNFSANLLASQNTLDTTLNFTAPDLTFTMSRIYPLKRKDKIGSDEAWYEKISLSYTGNMKNYVEAKEYEFTDLNFPNDWENGVKHSIPVSMNLKALNFFTVTPSFNYTERWYTKQTTQEWDEEEQTIVDKDTLNGFNRVWDYDFGVSTSTKMYTFYTPWKKLFGDKVEAIRHVMTPSASLSYRPDFADDKYGYYDWFEYYDQDEDSVIHYQYSKYDGSLYGSPGSGRSGSLGLSLGNTVEMKVKSDRDTTGFKKVKILESLNLSTSHNFLADSLKWSNISMTGRTTIAGTAVNFGANFDPYALDTTAAGTPYRINTSQFKAQGNLLRLQSANLSFGFSFNNDKIRKLFNPDSRDEGDEEEEDLSLDDENIDPLNRIDRQDDAFAETRGLEETQLNSDGYVKFQIPWNFSINYSMRVINDEFDPDIMNYKKKVTADLNFSGDFTLTQKWKFSFSSGYSFSEKELAHTNLNISRDLHCWGMSFNVVPVGRYKSYFFSIRVNSSMLQDLKYEKRNSARDNANYY